MMRTPAKICRIFVLFLLGISQLTVQAQQINKGIRIVSRADHTPVQDVSVTSPGTSFSAISDENGYISLKLLSAQASALQFSRIGFETKTVLLDSMQFETGVALVILDTRITGLSEVTVKANLRSGIFKTISDLDIHVRPINNSQEVLRMVPGLFIGQHAGGGKSEQIFLRGFDLDHGTDINIAVDGIPVNMVSHAHGQGYADLHWVIPELIERVNFNKGPYFADKGNLTTAGYVDFQLKDYLGSNFFKIEGGQFNTFRAITGINLLSKKQEEKNQSFFTAGEASFTQGYFESPQHFRRLNGMLKYHGKISPASTLTILATAFSSRWNASGQIPDRAVANGTIGFYGAIDNTEGGNTSRYNASASMLTYLNDGSTFRNQLFFTRNLFTLYSNFTFFKFDPVNGDQIRQAEKRSLFGYAGSWQKTTLSGNFKMHTTTGIQARFDKVDDLELTRTRNRTLNTASLMFGDVRELNLSAYWSEKLEWSSRFEITAGLRADLFNNEYADKLNAKNLRSQTGFLSPKLNFLFKASDNIQVYLYSGKGFHSNDTRVAVQQQGKKVVPPGWGIDLGTVVKPGKKLVVQTAIWLLWLDQEFIYVGDEGVVEAGGKSRRFGWDLSLRYELLKNLYADLDLNMADPRAAGAPRGKNYLPLAPRFTSVGGLTYRKQTGWNGSLRYRYMANRPANEDYSVIAKGYFVTDAAINFSRTKWEAGLAIQNLFNIKWKETQFDTESRLQNEVQPVSEIHFTPGTPFFARISLAVFF